MDKASIFRFESLATSYILGESEWKPVQSALGEALFYATGEPSARAHLPMLRSLGGAVQALAELNGDR